MYQINITNVFCRRNKKIIIKLIILCARKGFKNLPRLKKKLNILESV